jgi:hypothetical protein
VINAKLDGGNGDDNLKAAEATIASTAAAA